MTVSVERICNELSRKGLLLPASIRNLRQRWLREAGASAGDAVSFVKWLTHQRQVTAFQADVLLGRRDDPLVWGRTRCADGSAAGRWPASMRRSIRKGRSSPSRCCRRPGLRPPPC